MTTHELPLAMERGYFNPSVGKGLSWGAIIAGSVGAGALFLVLIALGTGLGLSTISAWPNVGTSATAFGLGAALWMIIAHAVASAGGGYLAGRLRARWLGVDANEAYFRDTAHGFLAWALCAVVGASALAGVATLVTTAGMTAGGVAAATAAGNSQNASFRDPLSYSVDSLFRSDRPVTDATSDQRSRSEAGSILANTLGNRGDLSTADRTYLGRMVAARTGLSQADAERRVDEVMVQARATADAARKAAAALAIWSVVAALVGALCSSFAAACGGCHRDEVPSAALPESTVLRRT